MARKKWKVGIAAFGESRNSHPHDHVEKTTTSERSGAVAGNPSSGSLQYEVKGRLSRRALDHHIDAAKLQKETEKVLNYLNFFPMG